MRRLVKIIFILLVNIALAFLVMFFLIYRTSTGESTQSTDAIVVLGAAQYDGTPSPVFQARLDHAFDLYNEGRAKLVIVSGGKQAGDTYSEAVSGKNYLVSKGVPEDVIITDENSFSTKQNLDRVKDVVKKLSLNSVTIVSDPFHMYRAILISNDLGLNVLPSPTRTSPINSNKLLEFEFISREVFLSYAHLIFDL